MKFSVFSNAAFRYSVPRLVGLALCSFAAHAVETSISSEPLATMGAVTAKPNLMFILDGSGSMNWSFMPDDLGITTNSVTDNPQTGWYGYWSSQCNGTAFDPASAYLPPVRADGTSFPNAVFTAAPDDGFKPAGTTSTAELSNRSYYLYGGLQAAMAWKYAGINGTVGKTTTFYKECSSGIGSMPGNLVFTKITMTAVSPDAQKYANWYAYYRKRYLTMRTSVGRAMQGLDSGYRVGFSTIGDTNAIDGSNYFRDIRDFDVAQKTNFYASLYGVPPTTNTPLRSALSKAGLYFANKAPGQVADPVQYSCQRNYALLSTDGYWNSNAGYKLDGSLVGNQDGTDVRPMRDNLKGVVTAVTPTTTVVRKEVLKTDTTPTTRTRYRWTTGLLATAFNTVVRQTRIDTSVVTTSTLTDLSTTVTRTVVTTDGIVSSDTSVTGGTTSTPVSATSSTVTTPGTFIDLVDGQRSLNTNQFAGSGLSVSAIYYSDTCSSVTGIASIGGGNCGFSTTATAGASSRGNTATATAAATVVSTTPRPGATQVAASTTGGTADSLADVAAYYYNTDLRTAALGNCTSSASGTSQDVCSNSVRPSGRDTATHQHMTTFTVGLGVSGTLTYDRNYLTQSAGSYADLIRGATDWPAPGSDQGAVNIDDLWHAAVNGRGEYYSALNAASLSAAIGGVVNAIVAVPGTATAAATSALQLVAGDNNQVYKASYTTKLWSGDLQAYTLSGTDASIGTTPVWSAQAQLDVKAPASRTLYYRQPGATSTTLRAFNYTNLSGDGYGAYFNNLCSQTVVASQCGTLSTSDKTLANSGDKLVDFLRGVRTYEAATKDLLNANVAALHRVRSHVLGDIINGAPVYVAKPPFSYADAGYADFAVAKALRKPVVYVAANDGMLHAFSGALADGGAELWAFVPTAVLPNLYKLADASYESKHQYLVDGAPVMADVFIGGAWKTILVGGLNSGGKAYYALDITDPVAPRALWEFTDANLGLSFGNPVITKRADQTWVVAFASGYNNTGGDGKGHLFVVDAGTGVKLMDVTTTAGSASDPSGLAKINAWIDKSTDNAAKRFYGGDLQGNLWRFDIDGLVLPNRAAMLLAKFQVGGTPQPITTKPETVEVAGKPGVVVGTGRYLGTGDIETTAQQSIYGVKDPLTATGWGDFRTNVTVITQALTSNAGVASVTNMPVNWNTAAGWRIDLPNSRERVSTNMALQFNTLVVSTALPNGNACTSGGSSWRYYLNVTNGGQLTGSNVGVLWSGTSLIVGISWIKLSNGNVRTLIQNSSGDITADTPPTTSMTGAGSVRRTSWRELAD